MLEAVTSELCLPEVWEVMRFALIGMFEAAEGGLRLLEAFKELELLEVMDATRRVPLCVLEAVEGELCLPEVMEVMRRVLLRMLEAVEGECLLEVEVMRRVCSVCWRM